MAPPTVRINTYLPTKLKVFVDTLSKIYIIGGLLVGINRVPILSNKYILIIPSLFYSVLGISVILHHFFNTNHFKIFDIIVLFNVITYVFCVLHSIIFYKRIRRYYSEINKFDKEVACRPKIDRLSIRCYVQMCVVILYTCVMFFTTYGTIKLIDLMGPRLPIHIAITTELHFYGHIVSLLLPRLRLINHYVEISFTTTRDVKATLANRYVFFKHYNESSNCHMKKIMDLYYITFQAYNYLIAAIKWQLLMIIIASFKSMLVFSYLFSLNIARGEKHADYVILDLGLTLTIMIPLFAPCVSGDHIRREVRRLRELLASSLYENKLDKSSRSIARALLEFTENRDLSFRLIRILDVNISLPFKFIGLLVTYLIILLQFEKVVNLS